MIGFAKVDYANLKARQKENYNFQKIASRLADYGFNCLRLSDDWHGADFIACHIDGSTFLKVQLKGRFCLDGKYAGKDISIAFCHGDDWYLYPHDELASFINASSRIKTPGLGEGLQGWSWSSPSKWILEELRKYKL